MYDLWNDFQITPLFKYIYEKSREAGLHPYYVNSKETIQLFLDHELLEDRAIRIGAIQYEGSNSLQKEPHLVNWRFERRLLPEELRSALETITSFRRDTNAGPSINPNAQSIAFKFEELNDESKAGIQGIVEVLKNYTNKYRETN